MFDLFKWFSESGPLLFKYLNEFGNPYSSVGFDNKGNLGLKLGVFGLPETFIVSKSKKIIYKNLGPITNEIINEEIKPLLK